MAVYAMTKTSIAACALVAVLATAGPANAVVLHDNADALVTDMTTYFNSTAGGGGWSIADDFAFSQTATITSIDFSYTNEAAIGEVDFAIYDSAFNTLFGVERATLSNVDTGLNSSIFTGHDIYTGTISNLEITLDPGSYWFAYQLIELDGGTQEARVAGGTPTSDSINGTSHLQNRNDFTNWGSADVRNSSAAVDFTLNGDLGGATAVPVPAPIALLLTALVGLGIVGARRTA